MLWEIKTDRYSSWNMPDFLRDDIVARDAIELTRELAVASACGYPFVIGITDTGYLNALLAVGNELPGVLMPFGTPLWEVWMSAPLGEGRACLEAALASSGRASEAYWGAASPDAAAAIIATQTVYPHLPRPAPLGLPELQPASQLAGCWVPHRLGWMNYWSEATAQQLGFPDSSQDQALWSEGTRLRATR